MRPGEPRSAGTEGESEDEACARGLVENVELKKEEECRRACGLDRGAEDAGRGVH